MKRHNSSGLSKQASEVYKLLLSHESLSAKQIEEELGIAVQNVYRLIKQLQQSGLIEQIAAYPLQYQAKPLHTGIENYVLHQRNWFHEFFDGFQHLTQNNENTFGFSFIEGREENFKKRIDDLQNTKHNAKFIVLGLSVGVSAELMYEWKQATERGVSLQIIVQEYHQGNREMLSHWQKNGADVRYGKPLGWHLFLFDDTISCIQMYDPQDKLKRLSIRFVHKGINQQLQNIFNKQWNEATPVDTI